MAVVTVAAAAATVVVAAATAGLEVAATSVSLDAGVAEGSEVAAGLQLAGAAAAGSMTSGMVMLSGSVTFRPPAANPGDGAACAKPHNLTHAIRPQAGYQRDTNTQLEAVRRSADRTLSQPR